MIRILIVTNDAKCWVDKITCWIKEYTIRKNGAVFFIDNPLLHVVITSDINSRSRGQRWNTIILDKNISDEIYQQILLPSVRSVIDLRK